MPACWFGFACWVGLLWFLSAQPPRKFPQPDFPNVDKVVHFVYFMAGGMVLAMAGRLSYPRRPALTSLVCVLVLAGVGVLDEWHQLHTPGRAGGDGMDLLADVLGGFAGVLVSYWFYEWFKKWFN